MLVIAPSCQVAGHRMNRTTSEDGYDVWFTDEKIYPQDCPKFFQTVRTFSTLSGNFPHCLEVFQTGWKFFRLWKLSRLQGHFGQNIAIFCTFCPIPDQKTIWTRCLGGFSVMWVTKLLISPVKKGFFAQKQPNLAQNWHFWSIWARPCRLIRCPVGGSVGGCGARAVSRKTLIYFIYIDDTLSFS